MTCGASAALCAKTFQIFRFLREQEKMFTAAIDNSLSIVFLIGTQSNPEILYFSFKLKRLVCGILTTLNAYIVVLIVKNIKQIFKLNSTMHVPCTWSWSVSVLKAYWHNHVGYKWSKEYCKFTVMY